MARVDTPTMAFPEHNWSLPWYAGDTYDLAILRANADRVRTENSRWSVQTALCVFCARGDTVAAAWLADLFVLTPAYARAPDNFILWRACEMGGVAAVQWLAGRFAFTAADIRSGEYNVLTEACRHNHLALVRFLLTLLKTACARRRFSDTKDAWSLCPAGQNRPATTS
jgi:hypothetical protein